MASSRPPGPPGHWLWGNAADLRQDSLAFFTRCAREFGDLASFSVGPRRVVLLSDPELIHRVLVTDNRLYVKHYAFRYLRPTLGKGLLLNEGEPWLRQRRLTQPDFNHDRVRAYADRTRGVVESFTSGWRAGDERDLQSEMTRLTLRIIAEVVLGVNLQADLDLVGESLEVLLKDFKSRFESPINLPFWVPTPQNLVMHRHVGKLHGLVNRMIARARAAAAEPGEDAHDGAPCMISRLLRVRDERQIGMSDQQLRDELITFLLAGHETTANALCWTFSLLAQHPEVEARLAEEAAAAPRAWEHWKHTERALLESMRLYPPVYVFGRKSTAPIEMGGYRFAKGATFMVSQWVAHRDPRYWEAPERFLPERWAEGPRQLPKRAYFPFGAGPRMCIGNHFALMEAAIVLGALLPRFRFRLARGAPPTPWPSITLRPRDGLPTRLENRGPPAPHSAAFFPQSAHRPT